MRSSTIVASAAALLGLAALIALVVMHESVDHAGSYREAVQIALGRAQVDYQDIEVVDSCAPSQAHCVTYAGEVRVVRGTVLRGYILCTERWTRCTLTLREAGIEHAPLPDVRDPLLGYWEQLQAAIIRWVRGI